MVLVARLLAVVFLFGAITGSAAILREGGGIRKVGAELSPQPPRASSYFYNDTVELAHCEFVSLQANKAGTVKWWFASSNENVSILLWAMSGGEYEKFLKAEEYERQILSDGTRTTDAGELEIPEVGWAFLFLNMDPCNETTLLEFSLDLKECAGEIERDESESKEVSYSFEVNLPMLITIIALGAIIGAVAIVYVKKKKKARVAGGLRSLGATEPELEPESVAEVKSTTEAIKIEAGKDQRKEPAEKATSVPINEERSVEENWEVPSEPEVEFWIESAVEADREITPKEGAKPVLRPKKGAIRVISDEEHWSWLYDEYFKNR